MGFPAITFYVMRLSNLSAKQCRNASKKMGCDIEYAKCWKELQPKAYMPDKRVQPRHKTSVSKKDDKSRPCGCIT